MEGARSGAVPRPSWSSGLQAARDAAEQVGLRAGGGKGDADARSGLGDASGDLEQAQPQCRELGGGERLDLGMASRTVSMSQ